MSDATAAIDAGALAFEVIRTVGPVGVIALALIWWKRTPEPERPAPESSEKVVALLTEIRDGIRDGSHERKRLVDSQERLERRLSGLVTVQAMGMNTPIARVSPVSK